MVGVKRGYDLPRATRAAPLVPPAYRAPGEAIVARSPAPSDFPKYMDANGVDALVKLLKPYEIGVFPATRANAQKVDRSYHPNPHLFLTPRPGLHMVLPYDRVGRIVLIPRPRIMAGIPFFVYTPDGTYAMPEPAVTAVTTFFQNRDVRVVRTHGSF